jgi:hypothetical protein
MYAFDPFIERELARRKQDWWYGEAEYVDEESE